MIIYEFVCSNCKHEFEELVKDINENVTCPKCRSNDVKRLLSAVKKQGGHSEQVASACSPSSGFT